MSRIKVIQIAGSSDGEHNEYLDDKGRVWYQAGGIWYQVEFPEVPNENPTNNN